MKIKHNFASFLTLLFFTFVLAACGKPQTPLEVSKVFWQAVVNDEVAAVVEYSTLGSEAGYESFSREWSGMTPSWGKIIIEEHEARVHTHISKPDAAQGEMLYFVTYLLKQDDHWLVDYDRTEKVVVASSAVSDFVNRITRIGNEISQKFESASQTVTSELESLNKQLVQLTGQLGEKATSTVDQYGKLMQEHLNALAESIEKAIKEQNKNITEADKKVMQSTVKDLQAGSKSLADPDLNSITETGEVIIITRKNLESIDKGTFEGYQTQWQQWIDQVNSDLTGLLKEIAAVPE